MFICLLFINTITFGCISKEKKVKKDILSNTCDSISFSIEEEKIAYSFEDAIKDSSKIEHIIIRKAKLGKINRKLVIPRYVYKLSKIKTLIMEYCDLDSISNIKYLKNIEILSLNACHVGKLPVELFELINIKRLTLRANSLHDIQSDIKKLHKIRYLDISLNNLKYVPTYIKSLHCLEILDVRENSITTIEKEILFMPNLSQLTLAKNPIEWASIKNVKKGLDIFFIRVLLYTFAPNIANIMLV